MQKIEIMIRLGIFLAFFLTWAYGSVLRADSSSDSEAFHLRQISSVQGGLPCDETAVTLQDHQGFIWIGTRLGLYRYDGYSLLAYRNDINHPHLFSSCDIRCLAEDKEEGLWVGTFKGLNRLDLRTGEVVKMEEGDDVPQGYIGRLFCDERGDVYAETAAHEWFCRSAHQQRWKRQRPRSVPDKVAPPVSLSATMPVVHTMLDRNGHSWMCVDRAGLWMGWQQKSPFLNVSMPQAAGGVSALAVGRDHRVWLGTNTGALFLVDGRSGAMEETAFRKATGLTHPLQINGLLMLSDGSLLIATEQAGLYCWKDGSILWHETAPASSWLRNQCIYSLLSDSGGHILVGSWTGLSVMDSNGRGRYVPRVGNTDISATHVLSIQQMGEEDVWLGLIGGILHLKGDFAHPENMSATLYTYVGQKGCSPAEAGMVAETDEKGNDRYRLGGIYRMLQDTQGRLWACTSEPGLLLYDAEADAFECASTSLGIGGDNVRSVEQDGEGRLWMLTNYGLACLQTDEQGRSDLLLYRVEDGLPRNYYGNSLSCTLPDGTICIAAAADVTFFHPRQLKGKEHRIPVITDIVVGDRSLCTMSSEHRRGISTSLPPYTKSITLQPSQNALQLFFSTFDFAKPETVQFLCRLEGVDDGWVHLKAGTNSIRYSGLKAGTYTFRVRTTHGDPSSEATLTLVVLPPLWMRWWAYLIYAVLAGLMAFYLYRHWRLRRRQREIQKLMAAERERNEELQAIVMQMQRQHEQTAGDAQPAHPLPFTTEDVQRAIHDYDADFLQRCNEAIRRHLDDAAFDHQALIEELGTSHSTLYRKLKALTGMDASTYIRNTRLQFAAEMLKANPAVRISELAYAVGFSTPKYFSTCFRRQFGMSPSDYATQA